ncbi:MAG: phosphoenolpyruvate carboxylase [Candidatus Bathyarchaeota archaeon]|nr:phosphoenolpyruvate carboxylase [Candidatus Bathyarchaeota archaeon]
MNKPDEHDGLKIPCIPCTMSTQHPDNANVPEWSEGEVINGNTEVYEAYYSYKTLGCQEVMWDSEGKDVDTRVVRKLLQKHWDFFAENVLGEDVRLTYRIPNPRIEGAEKKYLVETLQNIPVAYDVATLAYKREVTPIFEVILPFSTEAKELIMLLNYYKKAIVEDENELLYESTKTKDWIGDFKPKNISIIPLVEDFESIMHVDKIVTPYIQAVKPDHLRVFIARSDPALNYGLISAVLLSKIALSKLKTVEKEQQTNIYPILGVGSKPFRGHLSPENIDGFLQEYRGVSTVTVQSAFRYDYPTPKVQESIQTLNQRLPNGRPQDISVEEEKILLNILKKCRIDYEKQIENMAPFINSVASYVPQRRARKLHIGLFGYSRCVVGVCLPRAIAFSAALYSVGMPPEFLGMQSLAKLSSEEWSQLEKYYVKLKEDLSLAGEYVSWQNIEMLKEMSHATSKRVGMSEGKLGDSLSNLQEDLRAVESCLNIKLGAKGISQRRHENFTNNFLLSFIQNEDAEAKKALIESAKLRKCLG